MRRVLLHGEPDPAPVTEPGGGFRHPPGQRGGRVLGRPSARSRGAAVRLLLCRHAWPPVMG